VQDVDGPPQLFGAPAEPRQRGARLTEPLWPAGLADASGGVDLLLGSSHAVTTAEAFTEVYREALAPTAAEPWAEDWTSKGAEVWTWVHVHRSEAMLASMLAAGINANGLLHDRHMLHYLSSAPRWYYDRRMIICIYCLIRTVSRVISVCTRLYMDLIRYGVGGWRRRRASSPRTASTPAPRGCGCALQS
jgi:hypothetical protein